MSTVETWPGRGYYRGNKSAFLADAMRVNGVDMPPMRTLPPAEAGVPLIAGAAGTWVSPAPKNTEAAEMGAAAKMTIGVTDVGPALMSSANAQQMGYTGDQCDNCNSMKMQRTGHCNTCAECGTTTGCS